MKTQCLENKLVCGVGVNDYEEPVKITGKNVECYDCWSHMLRRCYDSKCQIKHPTYIGCTVCDEWLYFSNFKKWYDENYREGFHIDKDILVEGNKVYSPDTCRFVPRNINNILNSRGNARGDLPLGIRSERNGYLAQCRSSDGDRLTKAFKSIEEAVAWYSETKTKIVREVATRALEAGEIQQDIFNALLTRNFKESK